jgi:hypothetical protein
MTTNLSTSNIVTTNVSSTNAITTALSSSSLRVTNTAIINQIGIDESSPVGKLFVKNTNALTGQSTIAANNPGIVIGDLGSALMLGYNAGSSMGYIDCITPGSSWRNLDISCATYTVYQYSEDNKKKGIQDIDKKSVVNKFKKLNFKKYKMKDTDNDEIGFLASELQQQFPELIKTDNQGNRLVNYTKLNSYMYPALISCIEENDELKQRLKLIEEKLKI